MRRIQSMVLIALLLLAAVPASADMQCTPGMAFRGRDGSLLDCLEGGGSDCLSCSEEIVIQG